MTTCNAEHVERAEKYSVLIPRTPLRSQRPLRLT